MKLLDDPAPYMTYCFVAWKKHEKDKHGEGTDS